MHSAEYWSVTSGRYFYTSRIDDQNILASAAYSRNFTVTGKTITVKAGAGSGYDPLVRLLNKNGFHLYTANLNEKRDLLTNSSWDDEGIEGYADLGISFCALGVSSGAIIPPPTAQACSFGTASIPHGSSVTAYQSANVPAGSNCVSELRICNNTVLSGSYTQSSCTVSNPASCRLGTTTVTHGLSVTAYQAASVTAPAACQSQSVTCKDGVLSGGYTFSSCVVNSITPVDPPVSGSRGCTDDPSVPVVDEIDFATRQSFGGISNQKKYVLSTVGDSLGNAIAPAVISVRLKVVPGGGLWVDGGAQIGPTLGSSTAEGVISRCRGRFDEGGRVKVIRIDGYTGPGNGNPITFFANWWVDPVGVPGIWTAILNAPGKVSKDGWVSDGVYYVNIRQTWCSAGVGGTCERGFAGTGASVQH